MMRVDLFDYTLPEELIAQYPCSDRTGSRLMCINKASAAIEDKKFIDIVERFNSGDVLILNDTKVIPARLLGEKVSTQARIEVFLLEELFSLTYAEYKDKYAVPAFGNVVFTAVARWRVLINPSRRMKAGDSVILNPGNDQQKVFLGYVPDIDQQEQGMERVIDLFSTVSVKEDIRRYGAVPLPPYIKRLSNKQDEETYQTVFAEKEGAVAAPTAGLHFDQALLKKLRDKGVIIDCITLHVSYGTFQPVKATNIREHVMHMERFDIPPRTTKVVNDAKAEGRRVVACGTTTVRALESAVDVGNFIASGERQTDIFIYPSFQFKVIDALITNFHLPKSSLFMLVCAFGGRELMQRAYKEAIDRKYRFYSYGDAMFIM
jgi:S-adenosylmethionine:tRNA ribosyltransferase-isomerase